MKKLISLILVFALFSFALTVQASEAPKEETSEASVAEEETKEEAKEDPFKEKGKVLIDNDVVKIVLDDESEKYANPAKTKILSVGYDITIENKTDMDVYFFIYGLSVDGVMIPDAGILIGGNKINAGKKTSCSIDFPVDLLTDIKSLDDLKNIAGTIFTATAQTNTILSEDSFTINGRNGESGTDSDAEASDGQIILDNEILTVSFGNVIDKTPEYVGYELIIVDKTDVNFAVALHNITVNGVNLDINQVKQPDYSVAGGKKLKTEIQFITIGEGAVVKSIDDLKNIAGDVDAINNTANLYLSWPFTFAG